MFSIPVRLNKIGSGYEKYNKIPQKTVEKTFTFIREKVDEFWGAPSQGREDLRQDNLNNLPYVVQFTDGSYGSSWPDCPHYLLFDTLNACMEWHDVTADALVLQLKVDND